MPTVGEEKVMRNATRREFLGGGMAAIARGLAPLRSLAEAVKPVRIREAEIFPISIPVSPAQRDAWLDHQYTVVRIDTDAGVRGYSFAGPSPEKALAEVRGLLVGQDLFAVERHLRRGLIRWGGVEHAV